MTPANLRPSRSMSGRRQLALEAIRRHFCTYGCSPTLRELGGAIGMDARHVSAILRDLAAAGAIGHRPGVARSITLPDPLAQASTSQLLLALQARGLQVLAHPAGAALGPTATGGTIGPSG